MPLYEYACGACETQFERLQPMTADREAACPSCGSASRRILSLFAAPAAVAAGAGPSPVGPLNSACCGGGCGCA